MEDRIKEDILKNLDLSPHDFTLFLQEIGKIPVAIKVLTQILQNRINEIPIAQKMATSINFIVQLNFKFNDKNPQLWNEYFHNVATNPKIVWKIGKIFQRSLTAFMESFAEEFDNVMTDSYPKLCNPHKIMAANAIINGCEFIPETRFAFIQKSLAQYIRLGQQLLDQALTLMKQKKQQQLMHLLSDQALEYMLTLKQTFYFLTINSHPGSEWQQLMNEISVDNNLFKVLKEFLFLDAEQNGYKYFVLEGPLAKQEIFNNIKAVILECVLQLLGRYHKRSALQQFDTFPVLQFMELEVPKLVSEISQIQAKLLHLDCNSVLCISCLKFLQKSSEFIFMNNQFWENFQFIIWKIIYPLLKIGDEEIRQYSDDADGFIKQAESLIEEVEESEFAIKNCKTYASVLLEALAQNIDGVLFYITEQSLLSMGDILENEAIRSQGKTKYQAVIELESCFTILSTLAAKINQRPDLMKKIRKFFQQHQKSLKTLEGIDLARLLIYLQYTYEYIFVQSSEGQSYFFIAADCLQQENQTLMRCALSFFKEYKHLDVSGVVWDRLVSLITETNFAELLSLIAEIVRMRSNDFDDQMIIDILERTQKRVANQLMKQVQEKKKDGFQQLKNKGITLESLKILKYISESAKNRKNGKKICECVWKLFKFIVDFSIIETDDEIIQIFNILMRAEEKQLPDCYFAYLDDFKKYHIKEKSVGQLYETYIMMVDKNTEYLASNAGRDKLDKIIINLLTVTDFCVESTIIKALLLLQYIAVYFPNSINHVDLFQRTFTAYESLALFSQNPNDKVKNKHKKIVGCFATLWIIGSVYEDNVYRKGIEIALSSDVSIYRGFISKAMSFAIKIKIDALSKKQEIEKIIDFLKLGIRILEYRTKNPEKFFNNSESMLIFFTKVAITDEIREAFRICKTNLPQVQYDHIMSEIERQVPIDSLKQLMNSYMVNNEKRKIVKIAARAPKGN